MFTNAFIGTPEPPTDTALTEALGPSRPLWDRLLAELAEESGLTQHQWHSYSRKAGWALRIQKKGRNIVYLSPATNFFLASFALGEKAVQQALRDHLPDGIAELIQGARKYAEGRAVQINVDRPEHLSAVKALTRAKLQN